MRREGFTLIEVLVVLVIIGIFAGLVSSITQPDERALLRVEAERLTQLLNLASMQARLGGSPIAWTADASGYRFWRLGKDAFWAEIRDDDSLRARTLPSGMMIAGMRLENLRPREHMRIEFSPYGAASAFRIDLAFGAARLTVAGSPIGDIAVLPEQGTGNGEPDRR